MFFFFLYILRTTAILRSLVTGIAILSHNYFVTEFVQVETNI